MQVMVFSSGYFFLPQIQTTHTLLPGQHTVSPLKPKWCGCVVSLTCPIHRPIIQGLGFTLMGLTMTSDDSFLQILYREGRSWFLRLSCLNSGWGGGESCSFPPTALPLAPPGKSRWIFRAYTPGETKWLRFSSITSLYSFLWDGSSRPTPPESSSQPCPRRSSFPVAAWKEPSHHQSSCFLIQGQSGH